jgi:hypothetical protein
MYQSIIDWDKLFQYFKIYKVILKEIEPSNESKELRKKIYEPLWDNLAPEIKEKYGLKNKDEFLNEFINKKHLIIYYTRDKRIRCSCLGYKSAKKVGKVCHHLYEFYKEIGTDNEILEKIIPNKLKILMKKNGKRKNN